MFVQNRNELIILLLAFLLLFSSTILSQSFQRSLDWIPISDGEGSLRNIFSGGINNIEFQFVDIDNDEDYDVIFLDSDDTYGWYENTGNKFTAEFTLSFVALPGMILSDWFYLIDIDNDNDKDIFTGNGESISFFENTGNQNNASFELMIDTVLTNEGLPIFNEAGSNPVFADIDADGDFDFFTGNTSGTVNYYENIGSQENFQLKFITNEWQGLYIVGGLNTNLLHGASSLEFIDIDNDNDLDLFWGDFFSNSLYFLENSGDPQNPIITLTSSVYPVSSDSVNTSGFNMPRFIDIDNDNDPDLFVSVLYDPTVPQSIIHYLNQGDPQNPDFHKITENYLKTLDVISNSQPVFADIDNDGDQDLIIGSQKNPLGSLHLLENIGSTTFPEFEYFDSSYFDITGDLTIAPAAGDIDGDNDIDLLVGLFNGTIAYYKNLGTPESPDFNFEELLKDNTGSEIDVGITASPFLIDFDNDNDLDLSIGGFDGKLKYYRNTGDSIQYNFVLIDNFYTGIDVVDNSSPCLLDFDKNGTTDLFTGNRTGDLYYYSNNGTNEVPAWVEVTNSFIQEKNGNITVPRFIDIDNDTDMDLFLGNVKGGLYLYENTEITNAVDSEVSTVREFNLSAFPNPFNPVVNINVSIQKQETIEISIYNILGERIRALFMGEMNIGNHIIYWDAKNDSHQILPSGNYIVVVRTSNRVESLKVTFLK